MKAKYKLVTRVHSRFEFQFPNSNLGTIFVHDEYQSHSSKVDLTVVGCIYNCINWLIDWIFLYWRVIVEVQLFVVHQLSQTVVIITLSFKPVSFDTTFCDCVLHTPASARILFDPLATNIFFNTYIDARPTQFLRGSILNTVVVKKSL